MKALVLALAVSQETGKLGWDARAIFERAVGRDVALSADESAVVLAAGALYEDDGPAAGYSYRPNEEALSGEIRVRKELVIPDPRARSATLLVGPGGTLEAVVNDKAVTLEPAGKAGQHWQAYRFDPSALKPGANAIVLGGKGKVWFARTDEFPAGSPLPRRSARSADGGKTWEAIDGEYCVRLFLDHHRPRAEMTLPVLDSGNLNARGRPVGPPLAWPAPIRAALDADGRVEARARTGPAPVPGKGWSEWVALGKGGAIEKPAGRYVQIAIELSTDDPLRTPRLKGLTVEGAPDPPVDWSRALQVREWRNPEIVRSSIPFEYEPFGHPRLKELREKHKLDEVVKDARGELELVLRLAAWTSRQWTEGHLRETYPPWDALEILKPHADGKPVGGFCQQYNIVFLQACASFGIPGRAVSIGPGDHGCPIRGGHETVEIWSNEAREWIYIDGQTAWYAHDMSTGPELSLLHLRQRQLAELRGGRVGHGTKLTPIVPTRHEWKGLKEWPPFVELRMIPRSNFLEKPSPVPLNQGMRGWFWTGHYAWTDREAPASLLYGNRVTRRGDWMWTLNQARLVLEAAPGERELLVHLETETPGFTTFLASIDEGEKKPVDSGFTWRLHKGRNALEAVPRNAAGREGIPGRIVLDLR